MCLVTVSDNSESFSHNRGDSPRPEALGRFFGRNSRYQFRAQLARLHVLGKQRGKHACFSHVQGSRYLADTPNGGQCSKNSRTRAPSVRDNDKPSRLSFIRHLSFECLGPIFYSPKKTKDKCYPQTLVGASPTFLNTIRPNGNRI